MNNKKKLGIALLGLGVLGGVVWLFMRQQRKAQTAQDALAAAEADNYKLGDIIVKQIAAGKPAPVSYRPGASSISGVGKYLN